MVDLYDLLYFGEKYANNDQTAYYFRKADTSVVPFEEVQPFLRQCGGNETVLEYEYGYIPLFQVNVVTVEKRYIADTKNRNYIAHFKDIPYERYDLEFKRYFDGNDCVLCDFEAVLKKELIACAREWCKSHGIPFSH